jgi:hypothetical protein
MNAGPHTDDVDNRRLIAGFRQALNITYARLLETVRQEWEHNFAGKDPSDACVSVRVTSGDSLRLSLPCAGILRTRRRSLLNGNRHGLLA